MPPGGANTIATDGLAGRLTSLLDLTHDLANERDYDQLLATVVTRVSELLDADRSSLFLIDHDTDELWSRVILPLGTAEIRIPLQAGIVGWVVAQGTGLNVPSVDEDPRFHQDVDKETGYRTQSILCMPVRGPDGTVIGAIEALNKRDGAFTEEDESLLRVLCDHMAVALANAWLDESRAREVDKSAALLGLMRSLASEMELDNLLGLIMTKTTEVMEADRSSLYLVDHDTNELWFKVAQGAELQEMRIPFGVGIAGMVAASGEIVNIADAHEDPRFNRDMDQRTGYRTRSMLCMPMRDASGAMAGVLQVLNKKSGLFTKEDEDLLGAVASQAVIALDNARLFESRRREVEKSNVLLDVMRSLASEMELDSLLGLIMAKMTEVMQADRASLYLVDQQTQELWFKVAQGVALQEVRIPFGVGIAGMVAASGEIVNIADAHLDPRFNTEMDQRTGYRTRSMLCMPMRDAAGTIVGVLQVLNKRSGLFNKDDEDLLGAIASQAVIALENARLFDDAVRMKNYNESIVRSMATGIVTLDMQGCVSTLNPAAQRILEFEDDGALAGSPFREAIGESNLALWEPVSRTLQLGESHQEQKLSYFIADANPVFVNVWAVPLRDGKDAQIGVVVVLEDISREQQLMGTLSRVVSREVAEQIMASGAMPSVGGERKQVSVLMSDIRDFTPMTESAKPEDIVHMLNDYFGRMIAVVFERGGTLDKFIGDAIMAVFGTPLAHDDDPVRAVLTAIDMRRALARFNRERIAVGQMPIEIGIGICDGEAIAGAIGSEERMEFTVIGDSVNTAARLEGLTKGFPNHKILISESVYSYVKDLVPCDLLGEENVKGKSLPVRVYGVPESFVKGNAPIPAATAS